MCACVGAWVRACACVSVHVCVTVRYGGGSGERACVCVWGGGLRSFNLSFFGGGFSVIGYQQ